MGVFQLKKFINNKLINILNTYKNDFLSMIFLIY